MQSGLEKPTAILNKDDMTSTPNENTEISLPTLQQMKKPDVDSKK